MALYLKFHSFLIQEVTFIEGLCEVKLRAHALDCELLHFFLGVLYAVSHRCQLLQRTGYLHYLQVLVLLRGEWVLHKGITAWI